MLCCKILIISAPANFHNPAQNGYGIGLLIGLIETLIRDWYIAREERKARLVQIKQIADQKDEVKKGKSKTP
jgi:hypothetical protein